MNVFVTYENSRRGNVTGVYLDRSLAKEEQEKRGDLEVIDKFELKGCKASNFDHPIDDSCKYYKERLNTIRELIACLYNLDGCLCGGNAHIVVDDNNIDDESLHCVIEQCESEKYKNDEDAGLSKLICEELLKLSIPERTLLFSSYYSYAICDGNCEECIIENGELDKIWE